MRSRAASPHLAASRPVLSREAGEGAPPSPSPASRERTGAPAPGEGRPIAIRVLLLFLLLTLAFLHGAVFTSKLPVPVDDVARGYPYRGIFGEVTAKNPLTSDTVKLFLPWMQVAREDLLHGRAPLWNPYAFSGYPLLGNGESAPFSPLFLATLFIPLPKQIVAMAALKIFLSLLFTYLFARRYGASEAAACFAASAFAFSVFETVYLYYSTTAVTALLPAALYALVYAVETASRRGIVFVALVVATLMANGHPESVLHIAICALGVLLIERGTLRGWLAAASGALLGLALSAPAWVPTAQQVLLSTRLQELRHAAPASFPTAMLWTLVAPHGFGHPLRHNWSWYINYSNAATSYLGALVLVLAMAALVSRRTVLRDRLWLLFALLLWLVAMNWTFIGHALTAVPPFSITANEKLRFAALFLAAIVAARFLDTLRERFSWPLLAACSVFAGLVLYVWRAKHALMRTADLAGVLATAAFVLVLMIPRPRRYAPLAAAVLLTAELFVMNARFNALVDSRYYRPRLPILEALRARAPREPFRIAGHGWTFLPNAATQYGLEDVRGSDPMSLASYTEVLKRVSVDEPGIDFDRLERVDDPLLDDLGVRFLLAEPGASFGDKWQLVYNGRDGTLYENARARQRFWADGVSIAVRAVSPSRYALRIVAARGARIASSVPMAPGWEVRVGGRRVSVGSEGPFLSFAVPSGTSSVDVVYRPRSFWLASTLAFVAFCYVLLLFSYPRLRRRSTRSEPQTRLSSALIC